MKYEPLYAAVRALAAANLDHASEKNGIGYNHGDTPFGNRIAQVPLEQWNPGQIYRAYKMLARYKVQLEKLHGIDYDAIVAPEPAEYIPETLRYINADSYPRFVVSFKFSHECLDAMRGIPGARFDGGNRVWNVPAQKDVLGRLMDLVDDLGFDLSPEASELMGKLEGGWIPEAREDVALHATSPARIEPKEVAPPMKQISLEGTRFVIRFDFNRDIVQAVKDLVPGRKWLGDAPGKPWVAPITKDAAAGLDELATKFGFTVTAEAREKMNGIVVHQSMNLVGSRAESAEMDTSFINGTPFPYQKAGMLYMIRNPHSVNSDDMGLGKTLQTIGACDAQDAYPVVVVCPASVKQMWANQWGKWVNGRSRAVWDAKGGETADVIIVNYDVLGKVMDKLMAINPKAVVFDEAHYLKSHKAQRTVACKELATGRPVVYALTGTLAVNRPSEMIAPLDIIGQLDAMGGFWNFATRYCDAKRTPYGLDMKGASNLEELNEKLRATCYLRRKKADVLKELPAFRRIIVPMEITNRSEYAAAERDLIAFLKEKAKQDRAFHASIAHLPPDEREAAKEARGMSAAEKAAKAEKLVRFETCKRLAATGKMEAIKEFGERLLDSGEKVIWFGWHQDVIDELATLFTAEQITGKTPVTDRQDIVDRFQTDESRKSIAMNIQAGGVGLTLTAANNVVFVEEGWNGPTMEQAEARAHRIGQTKPVTAWYLLAVDTIDEEIDAIIMGKSLITNAANDGTAPAAADIDVMDAVVARMLARS